MNNEINNFSKIVTTVSNTSTSPNNCSNNITNSSTISATQVSAPPSPLPLPSQSSHQPLSTSAQFDVTVNAIAAVVNASNKLSVNTPPNAAAVVAVGVSSLAAAFIPDTPIVSIAGSTLSKITTTTTSTKTTPTPFPTSKDTESSNNNSNASNTNIIKNLNKDVQNKTSPLNPSSSSYSISRASVKGLAPMSVANTSSTGALTNASTTAANAGAAEIKNTNCIKQIKEISIINSTKGSCGISYTTSDSLATATDIKSIITTSPSQHVVENTKVTPSRTDDNNVTPNQNKSKDSVSDSWEESRLKDWDDCKLKELLDEAYSYKNPRDKENKSKTFLQLLEKAENEDQSYPFCVTSRGTRNLSNTITSSSYQHYTQNSHYQSHSHNHNRSNHHHHHHHKQGGSLQDLFEIGLHESPLDCDQAFGIGLSGNQRLRRQNHNSRQKKYSSSVSSRQREGGSLPSNVNVTHQLSLGSGAVNDKSLLQQDTNANKSSKKEQRRNTATKAATPTATNCSEHKENYSKTAAEDTVVTNKTTTSTTTHPTYTASGGDVIIDMGEPMMDLQQQQKILQSRGQDAANQGHPFYERLSVNDKRIPRANIIGSTKATYLAPTTSHCYVDETVRFNALERNGNINNDPTIDAKFLPLDDNYKACKSVLGSDGDKSPELVNKPQTNTIYTKVSTPASGSAILTGTTNNIARLPSLTQRQLDENGNNLSEIYQNSSGSVTGAAATIQINAVSPSANATATALLNSCSNVSTSATVTISPHTASTTASTSATVTTTFTSGPSQAKAKAKKKSQQERNTTTVDVESVAGYRGKDPVEELVKYIESSGEDKQTVSKSSVDKKKERKKEKEKHQKLKKSNSLEELRSGAKMEVHELKRTAATTESNAVLVRQKSGGGSGGGKKNNSSSAADINKHLDSSSSSNKSNTNPRKSERRSWGNEDLRYLEDQQNANLLIEEKFTTATGNSAKEKKMKIGACASVAALTVTSKEEKETKDKTNERNERNLANNLSSSIAIPLDKTIDKLEKTDKPEKLEKLEKTDKLDKLDKLEKNERTEKLENKLEKRKKQIEIPPNAVTVVDILAIESVLPETAEFHVVTKKKKPKKQKVINNLEETTVTFNRTHNFTMQKTSSFNQQQQQMTVRYKYYHHDNMTTNNNNTGISTNILNANSPHNQQANYQPLQQQHQQSLVTNNNSQNPNQNLPPQPHPSSIENYTITKTTSDKSRRKSTSSVPPSEKSDSSDLDSVHSLPIEATTKANPINTNVNSQKIKIQTRSKPMKNNALMGAKSLPVPVSYADIARTNKEIADAAANIGSASVILTNNNEISLESRNADVSLAATETASCDEQLLLLPGGNNTPTSPNVTTNLNAAIAKPHKIRKSQIKQDFPELNGSTSANMNDDHKLSTSNNHKTTISYSQSLTAVQNMSSIQNPLPGSCTSNDTLHSNIIEHNTKVSPIEQQKNLIVHQQLHISPPQHPQQQILQKSKSVENDNNISSTTTTLSPSLSTNAAASYLDTLNSNNLDQQYPALEKTFKRHSSANATITTIQNNNQQTPFNFAAAAKQQININNNSTEPNNINLNKNFNLTTSNTNTNNNNNTIQTALLTSNKKSKDKTPPPTTATAITQQLTAAADNAQVTTTPAVAAHTNPKKARKERQQLQQPLSTTIDTNQAKQNQNSSLTAHKKPVKNPLKTSNSLPLGLNTSTNASSSLQNRPAVIILNDYRNSGSCAADNQFTFGDFNEEELKMFDDDHNTNVAGKENFSENIHDIDLNQIQEEKKQQQQQQCANENEANLLKSPTAYFNDSGTSCGGNEMLLNSSIDASSPNTSFKNNGNCAGVTLNLPVHNNNSDQSSDSGIYAVKTHVKSTSSSSAGNNLGQQQQQQLTTNQKEKNDKLNPFLSETKCASNHVSMDDNLAQQAPQPPQQLETCNDIETAIIAAARAAAKQQQPSQQQQQQQQQFKNSNNSSNSSSFSSSLTSSSSTAATAYQQQQQQQPPPPPPHHHQLSYSNNSNKYGRVAINHNQSSLSQQQQFDEDYVDNEDDQDDSFSNYSPRSRSPSRPRCISIAGGSVANKEFGIHFIPPATMPTAFTTQQHNDIIVDFIGSAWEEVANSKVTKVYDGQ